MRVAKCAKKRPLAALLPNIRIRGPIGKLPVSVPSRIIESEQYFREPHRLDRRASAHAVDSHDSTLSRPHHPPFGNQTPEQDHAVGVSESCSI
jgi:hypothetical protein